MTDQNPDAMLGAGQGLRIYAGGEIAHYSLNASDVGAWREGWLVFDRTPLTEVVARWNDYFTGLVFIRNRAYLPLQTVLREILASLSISGSSDTFFAAYADNLGGLQEAMRKAEVAKYCCIVVSTVPAIVLYIFMQKYFVKGIMVGAVKG